MIDRYPHTISVKEQSSPSFDQNGDITAAAEKWSRRIPCRYETDGNSNIRVNEDGAQKAYDYTVYMRPSPAGMSYDGKFVRLYDSRKNLVCEGLVGHSNMLQLSTVLFVERCR